MKIKVGVIGAGSMGRNHIRNYLALNNIYEFVGFYDASPECAKAVSNQFNIKSYDDIEELLKEVDAVSVVVPSSLHKEIGLMVAENKVHAIIEKPLALNVDDCEELTKAFNKNKLILSVGHIERFNPTIIELLKKIKDEEIISIEAKRCGPFDPRISDTNVIMDLMIHDLDLVLSKINKSPVKDLKALGVHAKSNNRIDYINATIQHENGIISSLIASRVTQIKVRTIKIHTSEAYYVADLLNKTIEINKNVILKESENKLTQQVMCEKYYINGEEPLKLELMEFYNAIKDGKSRVPGEDATFAVLYANKIEEDASNFLSIANRG